MRAASAGTVTGGRVTTGAATTGASTSGTTTLGALVEGVLTTAEAATVAGGAVTSTGAGASAAGSGMVSAGFTAAVLASISVPTEPDEPVRLTMPVLRPMPPIRRIEATKPPSTPRVRVVLLNISPPSVKETLS